MKSKVAILSAIVFWATLAGAQPFSGKFRLPSLISSHMVLQQKSKAKLWGYARPGTRVNIMASWKASATAIADANGNWITTIQTPKAGGPFDISLRTTDTSLALKDVLIGEVWFCSGQSNMEMPMAGWPPTDTIIGGKAALAAANNQQIRLFNIRREVAFKPLPDCNGNWEPCDSNSLKPFSATGYFFGKKLFDQLQIPIGLIESSWGGTPAEAWISQNSLKNDIDFRDACSKMKDAGPELAQFMDWVKSHPAVYAHEGNEEQRWENLYFNDLQCGKSAFDDSRWPVMKLPQRFEQTKVGEFDGAIWYRKSIQLPESFSNTELLLSLGPIDDMDRVYINGQLIAVSEKPGLWQTKRLYSVPSGVVKPGVSQIAVRVMDTQGGGGMWGAADEMYLSLKQSTVDEKISLAGDWKYLPVAEWLGNCFYIYSISDQEFFKQNRPAQLNSQTPTVLFNGMVNPAVNYTTKGAIWYQGESNVGRAKQYARIFPMLINDWRRAWQNPVMAFYFVQLAPWINSGVSNTELPELREAQTTALRLPNTGMAVTLDIGNLNNIHPGNKKDVGDRLARLALAKNYSVNIACEGPALVSHKMQGKNMILTFDKVYKGLRLENLNVGEFEIAGSDLKFLPATARIKGINQVILSSEKVPVPAAARYCWRNGSIATLFNSVGLPAPPFRTDR